MSSVYWVIDWAVTEDGIDIDISLSIRIASLK